ncbi:MAG: AAA family ATPase [Candidatus Omnitrophica bacterium]|nr:AAA family ATPase [Candidatus Omnitrophota bacterium]
MSYTIAISGKGGTGKTTLAALVIRWLRKTHKGKSILAVDADPNANLDQALGLKSGNSIVAIIDSLAKNPEQLKAGETKERFIEYHIQDSLVEAGGFDLLTMGRPEGPGCYCYVNNLLRNLIDKLSKSYSYIVIDNEAGMEHLSRRTTRIMDLLFIVSDSSLVGLRSAKRILDLTRELELVVKDAKLVLNKAGDETSQLKAEIEALGISLAGVIPEDKKLAGLSRENGDLSSLSTDSQALKAVDKICEGAI